LRYTNYAYAYYYSVGEPLMLFLMNKVASVMTISINWLNYYLCYILYLYVT